MQERFGRYEVSGMLGEGGMGAVYRAHDTVLDRPVALKVLPPDHDQSATDRDRMLREAQAIARLDHPHIVRVYDVADIEGRFCIAMELVDGASLGDLLVEPGHDLGARIGWLLDTALALDAAHAAGIVHRDLKPDNVMLRTDGTLKVLDFGIATLASHDDALDFESISHDGEIVGTPAYIAPEQLCHLPLDGRADQFAWGVMAYELLTGRLPWPEGDLLQTLTAVLNETPPRVNELVPDLGDRVSAVVARTLEKDPEDRYASMAEAAAALAEARADVPTAYVPPAHDPLLSIAPTRRATLSTPPPAPPSTKPSKRAPWLGLAAVAGTALVVGALVTRTPAPSPTSTAASADASAAPFAARAITDLPDAKTAVPTALAAYKDYLATYRGGDRGVEGLRRALELDPGLTAAHMRLALRAYTWDHDTARVHAAKALARRSELSPRDQHMLDLIPPLVMSQPSDPKAFLAAAKRAVEAFPEDGELRWFLGWAHGVNRDREAARRGFKRATELDPAFAWGWQYLAESLAKSGENKRARATVSACLKENGAAETCRLIRVLLDSSAGRCDAVLRDVEQMVLARPKSDEPLARRVQVLVALGRPRDAAAALIARIEKTGAKGASRAAGLRVGLAIHSGDFDAALKGLDDWRALVADSNFEVSHALPAAVRARLLLEMGELTTARAEADRFLSKRAAWVPDPRRSEFSIAEDARPVLWEVQRKTGRADAVEERRRWAADLGRGRLAGFAWLHAEAAFVTTEAGAKGALGRIPGGAPPTYGPLSPIHALYGRTLLRAGRHTDAVRELEVAVRDCRPLKHPVVQVQAWADLGEAYEAVGDRRACDAYASILQRWSPARSTTAARAARRAHAFGCDATKKPPR